MTDENTLETKLNASAMRAYKVGHGCRSNKCLQQQDKTVEHKSPSWVVETEPTSREEAIRSQTRLTEWTAQREHDRSMDKAILKGVREGIKAAHDHLRRYSQVTKDVNLGIAVDVAATELDEQLSALNSLIGEG